MIPECAKRSLKMRFLYIITYFYRLHLCFLFKWLVQGAPSKRILRGIHWKSSLPDPSSVPCQWALYKLRSSCRISLPKSCPHTGHSSSLLSFGSNLPLYEWHNVKWQNTKSLLWNSFSGQESLCFIYLMNFYAWIMGIIPGVCRTCKQPASLEGTLRKQ